MAQQHTVLFVDDDKLMRYVTELSLEQNGLQVISADGGQTALELYSDHDTEIDLALIDIRMPIMDGVELYRQLRAINTNLPIVLCSGWAETEEVQPFLDTDDNLRFRGKPFCYESLSGLIERMIERNSHYTDIG